MVIQAVGLDNLSAKLEIMAREGTLNGCTYSISKFFAARPVNVVSGFQFTLDPPEKETHKIGLDPSRIEKLREMQPPTDVSGVRSFLGLVNQLGKFCSDYAMTSAKLRSLLVKGSAFHWSADHQKEFDSVNSTLTLRP